MPAWTPAAEWEMEGEVRWWGRRSFCGETTVRLHPQSFVLRIGGPTADTNPKDRAR